MLLYRKFKSSVSKNVKSNLLALNMNNQNNPEVNTKYGRLRGSREKSSEGFEYFAFKGIPYAKAPVGQLRFKDPIPPEKWQNTRDALNFGSMCAQLDFITKVKAGSDDCLYLNIYSRFLQKNKRLPVMFFLHGGGFIFGSGDDTLYGPNYLLKKNIVLVTINYRLGIFGFLNLEHEIAPGNQGLKDQVMALEWVRDNIDYFGGDPDNVTIFGESAGGASVHYLTLSPLAQGLFHKAISQSGVAINPFAFKYGDPKQGAYRICERLGKNTTDPKEIVEFLRTIEASTLVELSIELGKSDLDTKLASMFGPGVDDKSSKPFMPIAIENAALQGVHVPYLLGHTNFEGFGLLSALNENTDENFESTFENYLHPQIIEMLKSCELSVENLKHIYFDGKNSNYKNKEKIIDLVSDMYFKLGIHKVIKTQIANNYATTYFYQFTYDEGLSMMKLLLDKLDKKGATHMDELLYLFNMKFFDQFKLNPVCNEAKNHLVMERMVELWTNFAMTGNPTCSHSEILSVNWNPVADIVLFECLNIGNDLHMEKMMNIENRLCLNKNKS